MSEERAALGLSYQIVLDKEARRTLVFQSHVDAAASVEQINVLLDKVASAADRQVAFYELQQAQRDFDLNMIRMRSLETQMVNMEELSQARWLARGRKGQWTAEKLDAEDRQAHGNLKVSFERYREGAEHARSVIARCQPLVNGHGSNSGADSNSG